jgi:hypothetical protein
MPEQAKVTVWCEECGTSVVFVLSKDGSVWVDWQGHQKASEPQETGYEKEAG